MSKWSIGIVVLLMLLSFFIGFYYPVLPPLEPIIEKVYPYNVVVYPATFTWSGEIRKFRGYIEFFLPENTTHVSLDLVLSVYYRHNNTKKIILKRHLEYNKTTRIDFEYIGEAHPECELRGRGNHTLCVGEIRGKGMIGWIMYLEGRSEFSIKPYKCILHDRLINAIPLSLITLLLGLIIVKAIEK